MHESHRRQLTESVLGGPGKTDRPLREQIYNHVLGLAAGVEAGELPESLKDYVTTLALRAHETNDGQIEALRMQGFSDDAIFEITVTAATAAGLARLQRFEETKEASS